MNVFLICRVMQDSGLAGNLARAALERVRALYSPDGFGRRLAQFLADLDEAVRPIGSPTCGCASSKPLGRR